MTPRTKRFQWILSGATLGCLFALVENAHIVHLAVGMGLGAYMGKCLADKSPRQRRDFVGLWLGFLVVNQFFSLMLKQVVPSDSTMCCGKAVSNSGEIRAVAWALTFGAFLIVSSCWNRFAARISP